MNDDYIERLLDNLACASQERRFLEGGDLRQLVESNVSTPIAQRLEIATKLYARALGIGIVEAMDNITDAHLNRLEARDAIK